MMTRVVSAWMFEKKSNQEKTEKSALKKKPTKPKENDDRARQKMKVKEGATKEECFVGPVVMRAQAKKSDKVHPLKVKEAMSSVDKSILRIFRRRIRLCRSVLIPLES